MSRIAEAALSILASGPAAVADIGRLLASRGITRARDPGAAVRRALRDDPRVVHLPDGRLALIDQALRGVVLTVRIGRDARLRGEVDTDGDLAPLALLGLAAVRLPAEARAGDLLAVRVTDPEAGGLEVAVSPPARAVAADEADLQNAVSARLARTNAGLPAAAPVARLAPLFLAVAAARTDAFRSPGRPLTEQLRAGGWEVHLGWVGGRGTAWRLLTEEEVDALESDVADLLVAEQHVAAAALQDRVVTLLRRHLPERVPAARRRLARVLGRAGRVEEALSTLTAAFRFDDPEDRYEAALLAMRSGDVVSARRWANEGLAWAEAGEDTEVAACLEDIASDLDGQAAFLAVRDWLPHAAAPASAAEQMVEALSAPRRSYLVEALVEEAFEDADPAAARALVDAMGGLGDQGREVCLACAAVLPRPLGPIARRAAAGRARARRPWLQGLVEAAPVAAWATSPLHAPDQQQLVVALRKEAGRVAPLIVLVDHASMGGAVKDAFFLPDLVEPRLRREIFAPMAEIGLPCDPMPLDDAVGALHAGLARTRALGWELPSAARQQVLARIDRWVVRRTPGSL